MIPSSGSIKMSLVRKELGINSSISFSTAYTNLINHIAQDDYNEKIIEKKFSSFRSRIYYERMTFLGYIGTSTGVIYNSYYMGGYVNYAKPHTDDIIMTDAMTNTSTEQSYSAENTIIYISNRLPVIFPALVPTVTAKPVKTLDKDYNLSTSLPVGKTNYKYSKFFHPDLNYKEYRIVPYEEFSQTQYYYQELDSNGNCIYRTTPPSEYGKKAYVVRKLADTYGYKGNPDPVSL